MKTKWKNVLPLVSVLVLACVPAFARGRQEAEPSPVSQPDPPTVEVIEPEIDARQIGTQNAVAVVNGRPIDRAYFDRHLQEQLRQAQLYGVELDEETRRVLEEDLLFYLVDLELLAQRADALGIAAGQEDIDAYMDRVRGQFPDRDAFDRALAEQGLTERDIAEDVARQLTLRAIFDQEIAGSILVDDAEIVRFYEDYPEYFEVEEQIRAGHILLLTDPDDAEQRAAARQQIEELRVRIVDGGESFEQIAAQYSEDGSAPAGGDLGYFGRGQMVPEFEDAAFDLEMGEVSAIVETRFGYHLIRKTARQEPGTRAYDEVRDQIADFLLEDRRQEVTDAYLENLRREAVVEILL